MTEVLRVAGLSKSYPDGAGWRTVLQKFELTADAGEVVALMGPSGSGKSTVLNLLAGMLSPEQGRVEIFLDDAAVCLTDLGETPLTRFRRRHVGYVFQFFNLVPTLTVEENVLLPLELNGLERLHDEAVARLVGLGLGDRRHDFPSSLSGGERQRTAIARALAHHPKLVLADEPTGNLDAGNAERVVALLIRETRALASTLVMATHSESIAAQADRIVRLDGLSR